MFLLLTKASIFKCQEFKDLSNVLLLRKASIIKCKVYKDLSNVFGY